MAPSSSTAGPRDGVVWQDLTERKRPRKSCPTRRGGWKEANGPAAFENGQNADEAVNLDAAAQVQQSSSPGDLPFAGARFAWGAIGLHRAGRRPS